jgi:hypothetical protein
MTMARSIRSTLIAALVGCALAATAGAAPAQTAKPWWHMTVSSRPSTVGGGRNEVQQLTVSGTEGEFFVKDPETEELAFFTWDATHQELREGLEGLYGTGNVEVPKGQGNEAGSEPYEVIFTGHLAYQRVESMVGITSLFGSELLLGGREEAGVTELAAGRPDGKIVLFVTNLGDATADGSTTRITITEDVPAGLEPLSISGKVANPTVTRAPVKCELTTMSCAFDGSLPPYEGIEVEVPVHVRGKPKGEEVDTATVDGGGSLTGTSSSLRLAYGSEPTFGVQSYELTPEGEGGSAVTQAGKHPFQLTTTLMLNQTVEAKSVALAKDLEFQLPPGLVGNPTAYPECSLGEFLKLDQKTIVRNECRPETALGVVNPEIELAGEVQSRPSPLFNLEPEAGEPARFGFWAEGLVPVVLDTSVRTGGDYGVTVSVHDISQEAELLGSQVTFWGVPGSPIHDNVRGWQCLYATAGVAGATCKSEEDQNPPPFLSMPGLCGGSLQAPVLADSWQRPGYFEEHGLNTEVPELGGCDKERFEPSIKEAVPDVSDASTPSGLTVNVHVPQELQLDSEATAESAVKEIKVTLPEGMTVNPGGADGLTSCSEQQIGFMGANPVAVGGFEFTPTYPSCPDQSKIATVTIHTPLLPHPIEGFVYLATPSINGEAGDNPYNSLIAMYLVAEDPISGTLVKLPMHVELHSMTGQLVATVENPELPFEDAELHFFGGSRAPLATPALCGTYTTNAVFTPWSGQEPVTSTSTFDITTGPNGSPCFPSPRPFVPGFQAGSTNIQAGAFTPFTTTLGHPDGNQPLAAVSLKLPPGMAGLISSVTLCPEPRAREGTCGPESLIGHTVVTAGPGSTPAVVARPGNVYITGPYNGHGSCTVGTPGCAPFGLSIANPAETGPFDLEKGTPCDCVVVRAKIEVNPLTSQLTVVTDPLPTVLKGIPLQLQHVNVTIDRPGFTFNPTNCEATSIAGTIAGGEGAFAPISTPFQVTNCAVLGFKPSLSVRVSGKSTRANGTSVVFKLSYPKGAMGKEAWLKSFKFDLPRQIPTRLETLKKACAAPTFESNPASCPAAAKIGTAVVHTQILPVPLEGPVYFVSYGGAKFPEAVIVLQGDGVTVDLHAETHISENTGITSATLPAIPGVPFEEATVTLPSGPFSEFTAIGNICNPTKTTTVRKKLTVRVHGRRKTVTRNVTQTKAAALEMPTRFVAQNGAETKPATKISVTGCPAVKKAKKTNKAGAKSKTKR